MTRSKAEFLKVFKFFSKATYYQKIEYMKKNWGNVTSGMTINYADGCSVTVRINELNKYCFDFECKDLLLDNFVKDFPEYANAFIEGGEEGILSKYPEVQSFTVQEKDDLTDAVEEKELTVKELNDAEYINLYRGIKINKD